MRIVLFTSSYLPVLGGLQEAVSQLAREFQALGHEVLVLTNRYPRSLPKSETIDSIRVRRMLFPRLFLTDRSLLQLAKYLGGLCFGVINFVRLLFLFHQFRPDVVNVHFLGSQASFALLAARFCGVRCVVSLHGDDVEGLPYRSRIDRRVFETVLHCADHVTACSHYLLGKAQQLVPEIREKSSAIWNGICPEEFATVAPYQHPRPYLFAAGRLVHKKGFDVLLRAYHQMREREGKIDLILAGDGPERERLLALAASLSLPMMQRDELTSGGVCFWGRASRVEMQSLLRGCDLFVIPSRQEPFGIVALEALAAGKAIVASRVGGLPELATTPDCLLVESENPCALADGIMQQCSAPPHDQVKSFTVNSWQHAAAEYLQTYQKV